MSDPRIFFASISALHEMLIHICSEAKQVGFDRAALNKIEVASEEALVNVIHHAYGDQGGEIQITIDKVAQKQIEITISDQGVSFDPLARDSQIDKNASLEERDVGGLGIVFIRKCFDEVRYRREDGYNTLTLIKRIY